MELGGLKGKSGAIPMLYVINIHGRGGQRTPTQLCGITIFLSGTTTNSISDGRTPPKPPQKSPPHTNLHPTHPKNQRISGKLKTSYHMKKISRQRKNR